MVHLPQVFGEMFKKCDPLEVFVHAASSSTEYLTINSDVAEAEMLIYLHKHALRIWFR